MKTCIKCKIEKPFEAFSKNASRADGRQNVCKLCRKAYAKSPKGKAAMAKYHASPEGKAAMAKYRASPEGKAARAKATAKYKASPKGKAARAKYEASPKGKAAMAKQEAKYHASPKGKAAKARYEASPKGKATNVKWRRENYTPSPEWEIKKHLPHTMYLIRFTQGNRTYIKVGLTRHTTEERFTTDVNHSRMNNLEILDVITFKDFETCSIAESSIHDATLDSHVTPVIAFGGSVNECRLPEATEQIQSMFDSARAAMDN